MHEDNVLQKKSYAFALEIIPMCRDLTLVKKEYILSGQLMRSGTSVGANVEEAMGGCTRKEFYSKLMIAYREARESRYWIRLLKDSDLIEKSLADKIYEDADEICRIIGKIRSTMSKDKNKNENKN